jgi:mannitol/fructose-specific phosphotransferase system IIA component (Ntr-type)
VKVMIILLAPASRSPEEHLRTLADIARLVKHEKFVDIVSSARNYSELSGLG